MVALYKVKFIESYSGFPIFYHFKNLDNIAPTLQRLYPRVQLKLNENYFIRIIYVNEDATELIEVLDG